MTTIEKIWSGLLLFAVFIFGVGMQWQFEYIPQIAHEADMSWIQPPGVTIIYKHKTCYVWTIKDNMSVQRDLKVCRRGAR